MHFWEKNAQRSTLLNKRDSCYILTCKVLRKITQTIFMNEKNKAKYLMTIADQTLSQIIDMAFHPTHIGIEKIRYHAKTNKKLLKNRTFRSKL